MSFIEINNKKIELLSRGLSKPTILILSGMGSSFYEWDIITIELSKRYNILMYHRPGLGKSDYTDDARTTLKVTNEVIQLLEFFDITEPIVLAGHSYGGLCIQHFSKLYPDKVRGMLLLDSTSVDFHKLDQLDLPYINEHESDTAWIEKCKNYSKLSPQELFRRLKPILNQNQQKLPVEIQKKLVKFHTNPTLYKTMAKEIENWEHDAKKIKEIPLRSSFPVTIIGRNKNYSVSNMIKYGTPINEAELLEQTWHDLIIDQKKLYTNAKLIFALKANHDIHLEQPNLVIDEIIQLVNKSE